MADNEDIRIDEILTKDVALEQKNETNKILIEKFLSKSEGLKIKLNLNYEKNQDFNIDHLMKEIKDFNDYKKMIINLYKE